MEKPFEIGDQVHIDTDHREWGRVCSDGHIVGKDKRGMNLVNAYSIRANIYVPKRDMAYLAIQSPFVPPVRKRI